MSNPDVELQLLSADQAVSAAEGQLVTLRSSLETQRLSQEATVAQANADFRDAQRNAVAAESLAQRNLIASFDLTKARDQVENQRSRLEHRAAAPGGHEQHGGFPDRAAAGPGAAAPRDRAVPAEPRRLDDRDGGRRRARSRTSSSRSGSGCRRASSSRRSSSPGTSRRSSRFRRRRRPRSRRGQTASVDTRNGIVKGRVVRMDPQATNGTVSVDIAIEDSLPPGARPDLSVEGTIEIERLANVLHVGRPAYGQANSPVGLFKLVEGGHYAVRVTVQLGRASVSDVEVVSGLKEGDKVILSDMSRWDTVDRVKLN